VSNHDMNTRNTAVVFDLDGTLADTEPFWIEGFSLGLTQILYQMGYGYFPLDPAEMWRFQGGRVPDTIGTILATLPIGAEIGDATKRAIVEHVIDYVSRRFRAEPRPISEAVEAAHELHSRGIPLAVASSSALSFIDIVIRSLGLEEAIPIRVSALDSPLGKPDPATYNEALRPLKKLYGAVPSDAVAVEDTSVGVASAINAGMSCVWYVKDKELDDAIAMIDLLLPLTGLKPAGSLAHNISLENQLDARRMIYLENQLDARRMVYLDNHLDAQRILDVALYQLPREDS
jgi:HAD superfamily hydrolase (TIGR01509 family)